MTFYLQYIELVLQVLGMSVRDVVRDVVTIQGHIATNCLLSYRYKIDCLCNLIINTKAKSSTILFVKRFLKVRLVAVLCGQPRVVWSLPVNYWYCMTDTVLHYGSSHGCDMKSTFIAPYTSLIYPTSYVDVNVKQVSHIE